MNFHGAYSSALSILFPIFASYKALRSGSPLELAPWLMYWVVVSVILLVESWTYFIIGWYVLVAGKKNTLPLLLLFIVRIAEISL